MEVLWYKCQGDVWCELNKVDLTTKEMKSLTGVYVIWSGKSASNRLVLRVGSGNIVEELARHKRDLAMMAFFHLGVYVTWAEIPALKRRNVQFYLTTALRPKFEDKVPDLNPVQVNTPW